MDWNRVDFGQVGGPGCRNNVELVVGHGNRKRLVDRFQPSASRREAMEVRRYLGSV